MKPFKSIIVNKRRKYDSRNSSGLDVNIYSPNLDHFINMLLFSFFSLTFVLYVSLLNDYGDIWSFCHDQVVVRIFESVCILAFEVPCEMGNHSGYDKLAHRLNKSLSYTDSLAAKEWRKAEWVPLFALWS